MKQSEFQQFLIEQFEKQNKFNEQHLNLMNYFEIVWISLKIDLQD